MLMTRLRAILLSIGSILLVIGVISNVFLFGASFGYIQHILPSNRICHGCVAPAYYQSWMNAIHYGPVVLTILAAGVAFVVISVSLVLATKSRTKSHEVGARTPNIGG